MDRSLGPLTPVVDATAGAAAAALFGVSSALRHARTFHPTGTAFEATFVVDAPPASPTGASLFDEAGEHRALVRLSRGAGLPEPLPDIFGLAIRVLDAYGAGAHQDLLVNTAGAGLGRFVFLPRRGYGEGQHSSVLPYRVGHRLVLLGAAPQRRGLNRPLAREQDLAEVIAAGDLLYRVQIATPFGDWDDVAMLELGRQLPDAEDESLRFNPIDNTGGGIVPVGFFQTLRRMAYRGSQATRPEPAG